MGEYFLRLLILVPLIGGLAWGSLWLWKKAQSGLRLHDAVNRPATIVDVLTLGPTGKLAVVKFGGKTLLVATSRQGVSLIAADDGRSTDA
jgi:flagellar protein FliO/FliZ